jgi:hypothetical protein
MPYLCRVAVLPRAVFLCFHTSHYQHDDGVGSLVDIVVWVVALVVVLVLRQHDDDFSLHGAFASDLQRLA